MGGRAEDWCMRHLCSTLAMVDCWTASFFLAAGDWRATALLVTRAGMFLEHRSRTSDPREPWTPVMGAEDEGPLRARA